MAELDLHGFTTPPADFSGLYHAADQMQRTSLRNIQLTQQRMAQKTAQSRFLTNYLDKDQFLTGTNYDPFIVHQLQTTLSQGEDLASKGADTPTIMMALGPLVNKINQYSTSAKLINNQIKDSLSKLKGYAGYNQDALMDEAKKAAFYDANGKLKDPTLLDPSTDYVSQAVQQNPQAVTTSKGLDDFIQKTPMANYQRTVQTAYAGRTKNVKYESSHPFWMDLAKDQNGNIKTDAVGNPTGLDVAGGQITDDNGKPIVNPETNEPYTGMNKDHFTAIMHHNPDIADYIRGQINEHFKQAGAKDLPAEGSPQWMAMGQHILGDELKARDRSSFKTIEQQRETAPAVHVEIAQNPDMLQATKEYYDNVRKQTGTSDNLKQYKVNPVEEIGRIFSGDPDYSGGEQKTVGGREVIDVTPNVQGGGLKSGRGENEKYKNLYFDPEKKSLIIEKQTGTGTNKQSSLEEIPENKAGQFMRTIAEANGVPLTAVRSILDKLGYQNGSFTKGAPAKTLQRDLSKYSYDDMRGLKTSDGEVTEAGERNAINPRKWFGGGAFYIKMKDASGEEVKKTFPDKETMLKYLSKAKSASSSTDEGAFN